MTLRKKIAALALAASAVLGAGVATAASAGASTVGCTDGTYQGYCGTQTSADTTALSWDVYQQKAQADNKIIGYPNSSSDRALDFFQFAFNGTQNKIFEYAPNGVTSNLCISEPAKSGGLVLAACSASHSQQWIATLVPGSTGLYTWKNVATGDVVTDNGLRGQLTGIKLGTAAAPDTSEQWSFDS